LQQLAGYLEEADPSDAGSGPVTKRAIGLRAEPSSPNQILAWGAILFAIIRDFGSGSFGALWAAGDWNAE